jgi:anti-sigma regulatory factor (Ser/Thr protein kinase)
MFPSAYFVCEENPLDLLRARTWLKQHPACTTDLELVVTELLTNGMIHGFGPQVIQIHRIENGVKFTIISNNPPFDIAPQCTSLKESGNGLAIVEALLDSFSLQVLLIV